MSRRQAPPPKPTRTSMPRHAHPLAKIVFAEMRRQGVTYDELEYRSGVLRSTIKAWRNDNQPGLASIAACLGALGWVLAPVPRMQELPPGVAAGLDKLSEQWKGDNPILHHLMATVCHRPIIGDFNRFRPDINVVSMKARRPRRSDVHPDQEPMFAEEAA